MRSPFLLLLLALSSIATGQESEFEARAKEIQKALPEELAAMFKRSEEVVAETLKSIPDDLRSRLEKSFEASLGSTRPPEAFHLHLAAPFALLIEESSTWEGELVGRRHAARLNALNAAVEAEIGSSKPVAPNKPLTIVLFRSAETYRRYLTGHTGSISQSRIIASHTELEHDRMFIHAEQSAAHLFHEATHLLIAAHRHVHAAHHAGSLWFEEGLAEWFAAGRRHRRVASGDRSWQFGGLNFSCLIDLERAVNQSETLTLRELLDATIATRDGWLASTTGDKVRVAYAQAWALLHFLHHYRIDAEGRVQFGHDGRLGDGTYRNGLRRYVAFQLNGKDGRPHISRAAFQEALELDDDGLDRLEAEFLDWIRWLIRKRHLEAFRDGRIVGHSHHVDRHGVRKGRPDDDLLRR